MTATDPVAQATHDPCGSPGHGARLLRLDEARSRVLAEIVPGVATLGSLAMAVLGGVMVGWHVAGRAGAWALNGGAVLAGFGAADDDIGCGRSRAPFGPGCRGAL